MAQVYWENAVQVRDTVMYQVNATVYKDCQIISPHDKGIAASIMQHQEVDPSLWNTTLVFKSHQCLNRTEDMKREYFEYLSSLCLARCVIL
jgi:hypothetical protein